MWEDGPLGPKSSLGHGGGILEKLSFSWSTNMLVKRSWPVPVNVGEHKLDGAPSIGGTAYT